MKGWLLEQGWISRMVAHLKQKCFLLIALLITINGFSDEEKFIDERIRFLEKKQGYGYKNGRYQGLFEADLLYWKAEVDGVAYATRSIVEQASGGVGTVNTKIKTATPQFSYDPGFRLGLGFQSPFDFYDVFIVWTRIETQGNDKIHGTLVLSTPAPGDKVIGDRIGLIKNLTSIPNEASAKCNIEENVLDVQLARGIAVSRNFFMRPYFGVRGVISDIDWDIWMKRKFVIPLAINQDSTELKVKNDFQAVGGLVGIEIDWEAPMGLGVNIRGAGSLVWGRSEEKTKQKYVVVPAGTGEKLKQDFKAGNSFNCLKGMWELFAGVFWETDFAKKRKGDFTYFPKRLRQHASLRVIAGYEFQQFPFAGQKTNTQVDRERDRFTLAFQGFTGAIKLVF